MLVLSKRRPAAAMLGTRQIPCVPAPPHQHRVLVGVQVAGIVIRLVIPKISSVFLTFWTATVDYPIWASSFVSATA